MTSFLGATDDWTDTFEGIGELMSAIATSVLPPFAKIVMVLLVISFITGILGAILVMIKGKMSNAN